MSRRRWVSGFGGEPCLPDQSGFWTHLGSELVGGVWAPHLHFSQHSLTLKEESVVFAKYMVFLYIFV